MKEYISQSIQAKTDILKDEIFLKDIESAVKIITKALKSDKKVMFAGNGGSACDCNHLATEFISKFYKERKALNAVSLCSNNAVITALSNDYGYGKVFSRQVEAHGQKGDVLMAFSTSGDSENIIEALNYAKKIGITGIGFTGEPPCKMDCICDILFKVPSDQTPIIQESHIMLGHLICKMVEENF